MSDSALTSCIREWRQVLGDNAGRPRYIETLHRRGFRFVSSPAGLLGEAGRPAPTLTTEAVPRQTPVGREAEASSQPAGREPPENSPWVLPRRHPPTHPALVPGHHAPVLRRVSAHGRPALGRRAQPWGPPGAALAHAYTPEAITCAVTRGVRTIEHGNLIDEPTARLMAEKGAYLVANLVAYYAMRERAAQLGMTAEMLAKNDLVIEGGLRSLVDQSREFLLRREVLSPIEIIRQATLVGAEVVRQVPCCWGDRGSR